MHKQETREAGNISPYRRSESSPSTRGIRHSLVADMLQGAHPFPADIEQTLRRIYAHDPSLIDNLDHRYFVSWQAGQGLPEGRALLGAINQYVVGQIAKLKSSQ